jgi:hypothetical protein
MRTCLELLEVPPDLIRKIGYQPVTKMLQYLVDMNLDIFKGFKVRIPYLRQCDSCWRWGVVDVAGSKIYFSGAYSSILFPEKILAICANEDFITVVYSNFRVCYINPDGMFEGVPDDGPFSSLSPGTIQRLVITE